MEKRGLKFFILHALAGQLQGWADFMYKLLDEKNSIQQQQANLNRAATGSDAGVSRVPSTRETVPEEDLANAGKDDPPIHWLARVGTGEDGPPAHWLARVGASTLPTYRSVPLQKETPELLKKQERSKPHVVEQSQVVPAAQVYKSVPVAEAGQSVPMGEIIATIAPVEPGEQDHAEDGAHQNETGVAALPPDMAKNSNLERTGKSKEPMQSSEPDAELMPSPSFGKWLSPVVAPDTFPQEERLEVHSIQQTKRNPWPQASTEAPAQDYQWQGTSSEQVPTAMHWPSLPDEMTTNDLDWEITRRLWERQQRLNDEQRGSTWNT